jgi:hypothetical protein
MSFKDLLTKNVYVTSPRDPDSFFKPRQYRQNRDEVIQTVKETVKSLPGWKFEEH